MPPKMEEARANGPTSGLMSLDGDNPEDNRTPAILQTLPELAAEIRALHSAATDHINAGFSYAIKAGELLLQAKKAAGHGNFLQWVSDNCEIGKETVQRYIRCFERRAEIESKASSVTHLTLTGALKLIAKPKPAALISAEPKEKPEPEPTSVTEAQEETTAQEPTIKAVRAQAWVEACKDPEFRRLWGEDEPAPILEDDKPDEFDKTTDAELAAEYQRLLDKLLRGLRPLAERIDLVETEIGRRLKAGPDRKKQRSRALRRELARLCKGYKILNMLIDWELWAPSEHDQP